MKLAIIGGGAMGQAFARCLLHRAVVIADNLMVVEADDARRDSVAGELKCKVLALSSDLSGDYGIVLLAVKPQDMLLVCQQLQPQLAEGSLVVSIMAGITLQGLSQALGGHTAVVRCMPNLAVQVGEGMSVYVPYPGLSTDHCLLAERLLQAAGVCLRVDDERLIDAATAVSGSGPAYLFYYIEHMLQAAAELGFSEQQSKTLVNQTITGALEQLNQSGLSPAELRERVTSKGGTTAAALEVFGSSKLGESLVRGIRAAYERAVQLGR